MGRTVSENEYWSPAQVMSAWSESGPSESVAEWLSQGTVVMAILDMMLASFDTDHKLASTDAYIRGQVEALSELKTRADSVKNYHKVAYGNSPTVNDVVKSAEEAIHLINEVGKRIAPETPVGRENIILKAFGGGTPVETAHAMRALGAGYTSVSWDLPGQTKLNVISFEGTAEEAKLVDSVVGHAVDFITAVRLGREDAEKEVDS